jgi:ABC-type transport system involved in cytochrome c biogenesis permease subunit
VLNDTRVQLGALAEILTLIAGIGTAVALYPVLRRQSESLALGNVTLRVVESAVIAVGIVSLLRALLVLFGAYDQVSGVSGLLMAPEAVWELSLGIYLIAKGFRPDARVFARHAG